MNTLLYRAWHKGQRKMYRVIGWMEDADSQNTTIYCRDEELIIHPYMRSEVILMQSPGWTDKNGKTIYRDDVVRMFDWEESLEQVMWCDDGFYIVHIHSEDVKPSHMPHDYKGRAESAEVIGDIYTHPEWYTFYTGIEEVDALLPEKGADHAK